MNSECREMRSFASKEGDTTLANMDRGFPWLPKQWMLPQLLQDFHLPEMKDSLMLGLQEEKDKMGFWLSRCQSLRRQSITTKAGVSPSLSSNNANSLRDFVICLYFSN